MNLRKIDNPLPQHLLLCHERYLSRSANVGFEQPHKRVLAKGFTHQGLQ